MSTQNRTGGGGSRNQKKSNSNGGDTVTKKTDVKAEKEKPQPKVSIHFFISFYIAFFHLNTLLLKY